MTDRPAHPGSDFDALERIRQALRASSNAAWCGADPEDALNIYLNVRDGGPRPGPTHIAQLARLIG